MRILFVAPVEQGSGETITCLHMAESLAARGHEFLCLASPFARRFLGDRFPERVRGLGADLQANRQAWRTALQDFRPDAVVFADYPLLFFPAGASPLAGPGWEEELEAADAALVTLDHFGFAQEEMSLFFGPAHLGFHLQTFPAIPERMHILLPCPMHEPGPVTGRRGHPFRYWEVPLAVDEDARREVRARYLRREGELLVFHSVPNWAWRQAEMFRLPFYRYVAAILDHYLRDLPRPVGVVSVNNGSLLEPPEGAAVRFVNLPPLPQPEFEALLFGSDLMVTENSVSISMGKAVCGFQPCASFKNSFRLLELMERLDGPLKRFILAMEGERLGTVFPFNVYPTGMTEELDRLVLYRDNSLTRAFRALEIFGAEETRRSLHALLTDEGEREALRAAQREYVGRLARLGDCAEVLEQVVAEDRAA
jgi:uncharacterized protein DUF6365